MKSRVLITFLILLIITPVIANSGDIDYVSSTLWGGMNDAKVRGDYAFCTYSFGFGILNISDANNHISTGTYYLAGSRGVELSGDYAFVITHSGVFQYLNISDLTNPYPSGNCDVGETALDIMIQDTIAYVSGTLIGLKIVNISNPANPQVIGWYPTESYHGANGVFVDGNIVYLTRYGSSQLIIDVSDPQNPALISEYTPINAYDLIEENGIAYFALTDNRIIEVVDFSDPSNPALISRITLNGMPTALAKRENLLYVADQGQGMRILDITDPTDFHLVSFCQWNASVYKILLDDNKCYLPDMGFGLEIISIENPQNPVILGNSKTIGDVSKVLLDGNYAYVLKDANNISIVDISRPTNPVVINSITQEEMGFSYLFHFSKNGDYLYFAGDKLAIGYISDPLNYELISNYQPFGPVISIATKDSLVLLGERVNGAGLEIVNVSDKAHPVRYSNFQTIASPLNVCIQGSFAYVTYDTLPGGYGGMQIIDIGDPSNPFETSNMVFQGVSSKVIVEGNYAYLMRGITVVDISNPYDPEIVGIIPTRPAVDISKNGNLINVSEFTLGMEVYDISDPQVVNRLGVYAAFTALGSQGRDNMVYLADRDAFVILNVSGACTGIAGDSNNDGSFSGIDVVYSVNYLKGFGAPPPCKIECTAENYLNSQADANGNCSFNGIDVSYCINYLKGIGQAPLFCSDCQK